MEHIALHATDIYRLTGTRPARQSTTSQPPHAQAAATLLLSRLGGLSMQVPAIRIPPSRRCGWSPLAGGRHRVRREVAPRACCA